MSLFYEHQNNDDGVGDPVPHIFDCPLAREKCIPSCANSDNCGLSCLMLWMQHLDECARCVHHFLDIVADEDRQQQQLVRCTEKRCKRVFLCWKFKGDLIECCFKHRLKVDGYIFQGVAKQLEMLLLLDFEAIRYAVPGDENDSDGSNDSNDSHDRKIKIGKENSDRNSNADKTSGSQSNYNSTTHLTAIVFDFLDLFTRLRRSLTELNMNMNGDDLVGLLQTIAQQMKRLD